MITPHYLQANGLWNHFTGEKKWTITCGNCKHTWSEKLPIVETTTAICPNCSILNGWSASKFEQWYNEYIK